MKFTQGNQFLKLFLWIIYFLLILRK